MLTKQQQENLEEYTNKIVKIKEESKAIDMKHSGAKNYEEVRDWVKERNNINEKIKDAENWLNSVINQ